VVVVDTWVEVVVEAELAVAVFDIVVVDPLLVLELAATLIQPEVHWN